MVRVPHTWYSGVDEHLSEFAKVVPSIFKVQGEVRTTPDGGHSLWIDDEAKVERVLGALVAADVLVSSMPAIKSGEHSWPDAEAEALGSLRSMMLGE